MLLRFIAENFRSFKEATEFNTFPSSKSHSHSNHKIECGYATILRLSAIYGANGAGKSNLLQAIRCLRSLVVNGSVKGSDVQDDISFQFDRTTASQPTEFAAEFCCDGNIYYYHIRFNSQQVLAEELSLSKQTKDLTVFSRTERGITISGDFSTNTINQPFLDLLGRMLRPDMLLISFMGLLYPEEVKCIASAYQWFGESLEVMIPDRLIGGVPHFLDANPEFAGMIARYIPEFRTGISCLKVQKEVVTEAEAKSNPELLQAYIAAQKSGKPELYLNRANNQVCNLVAEGGMVYCKSLVAVHRSVDGQTFELPLSAESDGTRRLIDYMPLIYLILNEKKVFVVDEIERSIHPILIKTIISMLSASEHVLGQLIFTTHESCLLDQSIFRPDEIWFAEKDTEQATTLYPLSDYNIHKTANIENGYLNGRYGGIPFLSNTADLHW
jgi:hypothetical protein